MMKPTTFVVAGLAVIFLVMPLIARPDGYVDSVSHLNVEWSAPVVIAPAGVMIHHQGAIHEQSFGYLPTLRIKIKNVLVDSIAIDVHRKDEFEQAELDILDRAFQQSIPLARINHIIGNGEQESEIDIMPVDTAGGFKKISSFTLRYFFRELPGQKTSYNVYKNEFRNSVLASGMWFKIGVIEDGIYKITFSWLKSNGINISQLDPSTIRIFGNGGKVLPQSNQAPRTADLVENALMISGAGDGRFDGDDYLLFYGRGPHRLEFDRDSRKIHYENHPYSDTSYYFINIGGSEGKRIQTAEVVSGDYPVATTYDDLFFHEKNLHNLLNTDPFKAYGGSGRNWFGERLSLATRQSTIEFDVPGLAKDSQITMVSSLVSSSKAGGEFSLKINGKAAGSQTLDPVIQGEYLEKASYSVDTFRVSASQVAADGRIRIELVYENPQDTRTIGYLDYLLLHVRRELALYASQTAFLNSEAVSGGYAGYRVKNVGSNALIWDVSDPFEPVNRKFNLNGSDASFAAPADARKFIVFDPKSALLSPSFAGRVENQNLQGQPTPNLVIVTHADFLAQAERLADLRRSHDGYSTLVATIDQVYNEFSSGARDVTAIRNFMKYLYDRSGGELQYLLLFGKSSFDYRNILGKGQNLVPTYQSRNSSHPVYSYSSDDYFGFLDDEEGEWIENTAGDHLLDIGVGRIPAMTVEEAETIVDKLERYALAPSSYGNWRKDIYFIADDEDGNSHQWDSENLANFIEGAYPRFNVNKIYLDAYRQVSDPLERSPETNRAIDEMIEKGALIVNYTGHGSPDQWAEEQILTLVDINNWKNSDRLPLFVTATCQFGRHDNPLKRSGSEFMLFNPKGGAIGLVTTGRPVYASSNFNLNRAFYRTVFEMNEQGKPALGDIFRLTKNNSLQGPNNRNFSLLGDPSMKLAYPEKEIVVDGIQTLPDGMKPDTLKALQKVKIEGQVQSGGSIDENFNGILYGTLYDKESIVSTYGNKGHSMNFRQWDNTLFNGQAAVKNGRFSIEFIVPKNISYDLSDGKLTLYAVDHHQKSDASGAGLLRIGGSILKPAVDNKPPDINLYIADTLFRNGGFTGPDTYLLAKLTDESGINISQRGIGQEISASIDGQEGWILNRFYQSEADDFTTGWIQYPLKGLEPGEHEIILKAWDVYNNSSEARLKFRVSGRKDIEVRKLACSPNPMNSFTRIYFEHNRAGEDLEVDAKILSAAGVLVRTLHFDVKKSNSIVYLLDWGGENASGKKLQTGIYIFKIFVRSLEDGSTCSQFIKISLIN